MLGIHKDKFVKLGKTLAPEEFIKLLEKKRDAWRLVCSEQAGDLVKGAMEAFREGHPANVQTLMADEKLRDSYSIFDTLLKDSEDKPADLAQITQKMSDDDKNKFLNGKLEQALKNDDEPMYTLLMEEGFKPDVTKPDLLAAVLMYGCSEKVVTILHDHGASFDDAIQHLLSDRWTDRSTSVQLARFYQDKLEGPATTAEETPVPQDTLARMLEIQQQMAEQIRDLTQEVRSLKGGKPAAEAPPAAPVVHPLSPKPYPHI